jgi:5'-3' exonuclease
VLASAAAYAKRCGGSTVIVTSDRDAFALIDEHTQVLRIINGGVDASPVMTAARLVTLLGVPPSAYRDYAALRGDPSDNLPGVRGIGPRKAAQLLAEFGGAGAAFDDLAAVRARLGAGLADCLGQPEARAAWELNCQIMTMHDDVPIAAHLESGVGALPLSAAAVGSVFRSHHLVWSVGPAIRVLADTEPGEHDQPAAARTPAPWSPARPAVRRLPALPRRPVIEQLALFD